MVREFTVLVHRHIYKYCRRQNSFGKVECGRFSSLQIRCIQKSVPIVIRELEIHSNAQLFSQRKLMAEMLVKRGRNHQQIVNDR